MDLLEALKEYPALDGYYYWLLVIVDDYTRYLWVYGLKSKELHSASIDKIWAKWQARILKYYGDGDL